MKLSGCSWYLSHVGVDSGFGPSLLSAVGSSETWGMYV